MEPESAAEAPAAAPAGRAQRPRAAAPARFALRPQPRAAQRASADDEDEMEDDEDDGVEAGKPVLDVATLRRCLPGVAECDGEQLSAFVGLLYPAPKKRKPRRWLSADQRPHVCGIGGCTKSYGSASSLCAHKRAHHPGWKAQRAGGPRAPEAKARAAAAAAAAAVLAAAAAAAAPMQPPPGIPLPALLLAQTAPPARAAPQRDAKAAGEARRPAAGAGESRAIGIGPGATALGAAARGGPVGQWIALLAADASARCGALRRSRTRAQRSCRDEQAAAALAAAATSRLSTAATAAAEVTAHSAAARLFRHMDLALDEEVTALETWLSALDAATTECTAVGGSAFLALVKAAPVGGSSAISSLAAAAAAIAAAADSAAAAEATRPRETHGARGGASSGAMMAGDGDEESEEMDVDDAYGLAAAQALATAAEAADEEAEEDEDEEEGAPGSSGSPASGGVEACAERVGSLEAQPQSLTCTGSPASAAARSAGTPAGSAGSEPNAFHMQLVDELARAGCMEEALALDADTDSLQVLTGAQWGAPPASCATTAC